MILSRSASDPFPPPPFPHANWEGFEHWLPGADFEGEHSKGDTARWWLEGLHLVAAGHVAVLVLAGGQGTRLGPNAPAVKGMLELDIPPKPRSLFELQAEQLLLVQQLAALVCV
jgi:UDP-N-acetylglucosamine/UDP-N-acetylgalactosamine diphosphorylase